MPLQVRTLVVWTLSLPSRHAPTDRCRPMLRWWTTSIFVCLLTCPRLHLYYIHVTAQLSRTNERNVTLAFCERYIRTPSEQLPHQRPFAVDATSVSAASVPFYKFNFKWSQRKKTNINVMVTYTRGWSCLSRWGIYPQSPIFVLVLDPLQVRSYII